MSLEPLSPLLDEKPLDGVIGLRRGLGPVQGAVVVEQTRAAATSVVASRCQLWGGASHLLIPAASTGGPAPQWREVLAASGCIGFREAGSPSGQRRAEADPLVFGIPEPIAVVIASLDREPSNLPSLHVPELSEQDPWWVAYMGVIGWIPEAPDPKSLEMSVLRPEVRYDELLEIDRVGVEGSADDLLARLRNGRASTPIQVTLMMLGVPQHASGAYATDDRLLSSRERNRRRFGPNVVVVYEPGSIADLCLIWSMRASMGWPFGFPLAVPNIDGAADFIAGWHAQRARSWTNFAAPEETGVTSASLHHDEIEALCLEFGDGYAVAEVEDVLEPAVQPARHSSEMATFRNGQARIATWAPQDIQELGRNYSRYDGFGLAVRVRPLVRELPPYRSLAVSRMGRGIYCRGSFEHSAGAPGSLLDITWPTGWTVLQALARDRGLQVRRSAAGEAAEAFTHRVGDLSDVELLASRDVLQLLYRLCERSGMTWFRARVNALLRKVESAPDQDRAGAVEAYLRDLAASREDAALRSVTPHQAGLKGSREQVAEWFAWAEASGVLVRGAVIECDSCHAKSWRAVAELAPPIACPSCGRLISRPFRHDVLQFRYRAAEPLLRIVEHDALGHLLTLSWMVSLFRSGFDRTEFLYGGHPGVEFLRNGVVIGEADVFLLFSDGSVAVGEYKRSAVGLNQGEVDKLDRLADHLGAAWTFVATHADAVACPAIWKDSQATRPERPRVALCGERLFRIPLRTLGKDPFAWPGAADASEVAKLGPAEAAEWLAESIEPDRELRDAWRYEDSKSARSEQDDSAGG